MNEKTVTDAKINNFAEMESVLSVKTAREEGLLSLFGHFSLGNVLRHLSLEKKDGVSALTLILALCLFRINGLSVFAAYKNRFYNMLSCGKNCFYRMMTRPQMDWRRLLLGVVCRFNAILRKEKVEDTGRPHCYIIDDTLLGKTGRTMECVSRVFDHVSGRCVLGFKLLLLAVTDGVSTIPVDFSLHREKGKKGDYGLTAKDRKRQFTVRRKKESPDKQRVEECDRSKLDMAVELVRRAWKRGIRADFVLADSWFAYESVIKEIRKIAGGAVHYIGLARNGNVKYDVRGQQNNAKILTVKYQREAKQCRKYKCKYIALRGKLGSQPVRIFLIKYGRRESWNVLLSTNLRMSFVKAFEIYQLRWNIEVLNKECKEYLGLGQWQGRDFNGQIADCTLCFITYTVLALGKRFSDYETMGELYRSQRDELLALTLWSRVLQAISSLLDCLAELLGLSTEELMTALLSCDKSARELLLALRIVHENRRLDSSATAYIF